MEVTRRDLLKVAGIAATVGLTGRALAEADDAPERLLEFESLGNVTLLHLTDTHATLPRLFREPDTLLGVGDERGKPPYLTGRALLAHYRIPAGTAAAYALTRWTSRRWPRATGDSAATRTATLIKRVRAERPSHTLLLDGGDALQGSATALWSRGEDMLRATNQLGVEVFTAHWEFIYGVERVRELFGDRERPGRFAGDFIAQNVSEAGWGDRMFRPYTVREVGGVRSGDRIGHGEAVEQARDACVPDLTFSMRGPDPALIASCAKRGGPSASCC
jgi:sulfur-oxidizing protein SoxB